jgi:hypothetical protein
MQTMSGKSADATEPSVLFGRNDTLGKTHYGGLGSFKPRLPVRSKKRGLEKARQPKETITMNQQDFEQSGTSPTGDRSMPGANVWNETHEEATGESQPETLWTNSKEKAVEALQRGGEYLRENPIPVLATALIFGFAVGLLAGPHRTESWQERHIQEPLEESRGAILGVLLALAAVWKRFFRSASSAARATGESVSSQTERLAKTARRAGRKLRFS